MARRFKGKFLLMVVTLFVAIPLLSCSKKMYPAGDPAGVVAPSAEKMAEDILVYVNDYRQKKGLDALQMNAVISATAEQHSKNMANRKTAFGHDGFEERVRAISQKVGSLRKSAENVAYGSLSAKQVVDVWLKSPGHRRNIEGKYTVTGIGTATSSDGTIFFTQIFGAM